MAIYNKFNDFSEQLVRGVHDFDAHTFKVYLTNTTPLATHTVKANVAEIAPKIGHPAGGKPTTISVARSGSTTTVSATDVTFTADAAETIGPFQYAVVYNDTPATPADPLIAWFDYGAPITLGGGESFLVDFDATGLFTLG